MRLPNPKGSETNKSLVKPSWHTPLCPNQRAGWKALQFMKGVFRMTNRDKSVLTKICKQSDSFAKVLIMVHDNHINCSISTIKKYWKIFGKKEKETND